MQRSESVTAVAKALHAARAEFRPITRDKINPHFKSKYADLACILDAIRDGFAAHGLILLQPTEEREDGAVVETIIMHAPSGEWLGSTYAVKYANRDDAQGKGAGLTYARRFALSSMLGLAADDDDDGNAAAARHQSNGHARPEPPRPAPEAPRQAHTFDLEAASKWVGCDKWRLMNHLFKEGRDAGYWAGMPDDNSTRMKRLAEYARSETGLAWLRARCQAYRAHLEQERASKPAPVATDADPDLE